MTRQRPIDGRDVRQDATEIALAAVGTPQPAPGSARKALLSHAEVAALFGISKRKFHELRHEPWMPKPVVLGPRVVRFVRAELEAAVAQMPRTDAQHTEPHQLRLGRSAWLKAQAAQIAAAQASK